MSDVKQRLRDLDRLHTPDVWGRATSTEPRTDVDEVLGGPPPSRRIAAAVVALVVFLAAGGFAWRALRSQPATTPAASASNSIDGTILWPERTADDLAATQAKADAGDPSVTWRLDPEKVASHFAQDLLGWGPPGNGYGLEVDPASSGTAAQVVLSWIAMPCPSPMPGEQSICPPPYQGETFTLEQAGKTGDTGIWSVTSVRASGLDLSLDPGATVSGDESVSGRVGFPDTAFDDPNFSGWAGWSIDGSSDGTCDAAGGQEPLQPGDVEIGPMDQDAPMCAGIGYTWIATTEHDPQTGSKVMDPLAADWSDVSPKFYGVTIVPMIVTASQTGGSPKPSSKVGANSSIQDQVTLVQQGIQEHQAALSKIPDSATDAASVAKREAIQAELHHLQAQLAQLCARLPSGTTVQACSSGG